MSYTEISAYKCVCERCNHEWSAFKIPLTCSKCRSPYWNVPKGMAVSLEAPEKKSTLPTEDRKKELAELQKLLIPKQKFDYSTKPVVPAHTVDQPDYYDFEKSFNYD